MPTFVYAKPGIQSQVDWADSYTALHERLQGQDQVHDIQHLYFLLSSFLRCCGPEIVKIG